MRSEIISVYLCDNLIRKEWRVNGNLHREDGPAAEYTNGDKFWHMHSYRHRIDGPSIEFASGEKHWYFYGFCCYRYVCFDSYKEVLSLVNYIRKHANK